MKDKFEFGEGKYYRGVFLKENDSKRFNKKIKENATNKRGIFF